jgi:hypothetical protein
LVDQLVLGGPLAARDTFEAFEGPQAFRGGEHVKRRLVLLPVSRNFRRR